MPRGHVQKPKSLLERVRERKATTRGPSSWIDKHPQRAEIIECVKAGESPTKILLELRDGGDKTVTRHKIQNVIDRVREGTL